jgi:hypothetical protein
MPLRFSYIWQGADEIPIFRWLVPEKTDTNEKLIHVYSMFMNRPADPEIWRSGKRIFYSGEYIMDEEHADVIVRFMPADDNTNRRCVLKMTAPPRVITAVNNRPGTRYIQLRLQELDAIEYKIKGLSNSGILAQQSIADIRNYLLTPGNITPYADMMLSWTRNKPSDDSSSIGQRQFCLFMVSNPNCKLRNDTFMLLSRVGRVVSAGGFRNNLAVGDARPPDRMLHDEHIKYLRQFRFMITFENQSLPHYHTEKITNAFEAGVIPIYWGDPFITDMFDSRSFIHIPTLDNPNQQWEAVKHAVERVREAETNPAVYASYFQYPPISPDKVASEDMRVAASLAAISDELNC